MFTFFNRNKKTDHPVVAEKDRVPLKEKLAYGAGGVSMGIQEGFDNQVINPVFLVGVGIAPELLGIFGMVYRLWDALTDMAMGVVSDNTRSRWGRRRPYMFVGAILMGLAMPWLFFFNPEWSVTAITVWMVGFSLILYLTLTIYNVPYQCMLIECTSDTNERTNVASWRALVGVAVGIIISWSWSASQLEIFHVNGEPNVLNGIRWLTCIMMIPVVILGILPAIFMKERFYKLAEKQAKIPFWPSFKASLRNRPFLVLLLFTLIFMGGTRMHWTLVFYVRLFYVCEGSQELAAQIGGWQGTLQALIAITGIPAARWLALKIGKMRALSIGIAISLVAYLSTFVLMTPTMPYLSIIPFILMGPANSMIWVMIPSMIGDVVDYGELKTGTRDEGVFSAAYSWIVKLSLTLGVLSGFLVSWAGYTPEIRNELAQHTDILLNMRLLVTLVPSISLGLAMMLLFLYPLKTKRINEIRAELELRRGEV